MSTKNAEGQSKHIDSDTDYAQMAILARIPVQEGVHSLLFFCRQHF